MGKHAALTICGPETRRSQSRLAARPRNRSELSPGPFAPAQGGLGNLALQYSSMAPAPAAPGGCGCDADAENIAMLGNRELVDAILAAEDGAPAGPGRADAGEDCEACSARSEQLECERQARIGMGHMWLENAHVRQSTRLFQLVPGAHDALDVVAVENEELINGQATDISSRPIMTEAQLKQSLASRSVPTVTVQEYLGRLEQSFAALGDAVQTPDLPGEDFADAMAGPAAPATPMASDASTSPTYGLAGAVSQSGLRANLLQDAFSLVNPRARQGAIGEAYFGSSAEAGYGFGARDYNAMPWTHPTRGVEVGNHPVVDYRLLFGARPEVSVKTSTVPGGDPFRRYGTYLRGFAEMMDTAPDYAGFDHYMNNAARGRTAAGVRSELSLVINADDVADFRRFVSDPFARETTPGGRPARDPNYRRTPLMRVYDGVLQDRPLVLPDGTSLNTVAALDAALDSNSISAAEHRAALLGASRDAAARITPNPDLTRATLGRFDAARTAVPATMSARDVRAAVSPEYMSSLAHGGGWRGDLHAAGEYGGKGALIAGLIGMGREGLGMYGDDQDHPDAFYRVLRAGGREGLRGGATSGLETLAASRASQYALTRGLAAGSGRALASRLGARFVPGGLVDAGFEVKGILSEDRTHRPAEVGYRMTRAFVIGGSSALAGATAGAWAGTAIGTAVFPGVGTVVGFIVGVLVGALVGFIMNDLIPNYEEMVMEQVPLREFEKNIEAQTPRSIQNQALAEQELALLQAVANGPETRGPHAMMDVYQHRNLSNSPGARMFDEALIAGNVHGGCMECHTSKARSDIDARFGAFDEARLAPVDRMYLAAHEEAARTGKRPRYFDWDMPGQTVPGDIAARTADDPTAAVMIDAINTIQPNFAAWREVLGAKGEGLIPRDVMNRPADEQALYDDIRGNIDRRQWFFELLFGKVGDDEYELFRAKLKQAQEEEAKRKTKQ